MEYRSQERNAYEIVCGSLKFYKTRCKEYKKLILPDKNIKTAIRR